MQEYEELMTSLSIELEQVKGQLMVANRQDPELLKLRQEIVAIKVTLYCI